MAKQGGFTKIDTGKVVNLLIDTIKQEVKGSVRVALDGFRVFHVIPGPPASPFQ